jgi:hypothetical protein
MRVYDSECGMRSPEQSTQFSRDDIFAEKEFIRGSRGNVGTVTLERHFVTKAIA